MAPAPREPAVAAAVEPVASHATEHPGLTKKTLQVQAGDTLWSISRRLGVELQELCRWNGIENPRRHKLLVGAHLVDEKT